MVAPKSLSEQDVVEARAAVAAGKPFTVWFTAAAVGVQAGGSAKVVALDDAGEGDFIQVKPTGSRDTMFCSPSELTRTRPARKKPEPPAPAVKPTSAPVVKPAAAPASPPQPPAPAPVPVAVPVAAAEPAPEPKVSRPRAAAARPSEVTLTLSATTDGEWSVEVMIGKKRVVRPTPVQPGDVAKAARSLPGEVTEAIESSLQAARSRQVERVERLRAELKSAEQALQELSG